MMTATNRKYLGYALLAAGALALYWWYRQRQQGMIGQAPSGSATTNPVVINGTLATAPGMTIDNPTIVAARNQATGPNCRKACLFPRRWINTITGPLYGVCVDQTQFDRWIAQPGDVQLKATAETVAAVLGIAQPGA